MTGVLACACDRAFPEKTAASGLKQLTGAGRVEIVKDLCSASGIAAAAGKIREHGIDRIVLAGCPVIERTGLAAMVAEAAGIPAPYATFVLLPPNADAAGAAPTIRKALAALEAMPVFETRKVKLAQDVLVIGAGPAGREAARSLASLGHAVTVIDRSEAAPTSEAAAARARGADGDDRRGFRGILGVVPGPAEGIGGHHRAHLRRGDRRHGARARGIRSGPVRAGEDRPASGPDRSPGRPAPAAAAPVPRHRARPRDRRGKGILR